MLELTRAEWDAIHPDFKGVWETERTDLRDWAEVRSQYMGKRTLLRYGALHIEGLSFQIVSDGQVGNANRPVQGRTL